MPEIKKEIDQGNRTGRFAIWKDFDHSVPDWDAAFALGFPRLLERTREYRARRAAAGQTTAESYAYFDGIEITHGAILRMLTRIRDYAQRRGGPRSLSLAKALARLVEGPPAIFTRPCFSISCTSFQRAL